ncbi:polysaccharide biosynthesis tyrosine autokinase [Mycolicibacterium sp. 22603]|uniref:polysaccharide biosynthesis tyrosine autokinase n=1 Tax=Mycolicibacterium sp. 22603 TaxID=3453950 RepID=UPI003F848037
MKLQDFARVLRARWLIVCGTLAASVIVAVIITAMTTPLYQASTRLFVSTESGSSLAEAYQGNRFSQERVKSYAELIKGQTVAQRTIDKLGLDMSAAELQEKVKASAKLDTVLINVQVLDESPVRARDIANSLSDEFVGIVRELETPEPGATPNARVVVEQRASIPEHPVTPDTTRNIGLGVILGLALGVGLAVLRDMMDNTVKDRPTLEAITNTGVVGHIPLDKNRRKEPAISFEGDRSAISEAFRKLRTNLQFLAVDNPPRAIVITSSVPAEGKSTTAVNIALALAEAEHNVVIIDGDLRRPSLHKYLNLVGTVGFSTVLSGGVSLSEALQRTRFPGLTALTSGAIPPNPSELLGSQAARKVLAELRAEFDYVIVDSTPLLAVTDAAILAAGADGVLLMARFGKTKRDELAHAVGSLEGVGAPILGTVFTMLPNRGSSSYGYGYSYYGTDDSQNLMQKSTTDSSPKSSPPSDPTRVAQTQKHGVSE